jgi:hypothetical protein
MFMQQCHSTSSCTSSCEQQGTGKQADRHMCSATEMDSQHRQSLSAQLDRQELAPRVQHASRLSIELRAMLCTPTHPHQDPPIQPHMP